MSTIMPKTELVKKALAWMDEKMAEGEGFAKCLEQAAMQFNLSPNDMEFLKRFYAEKREGE